MKRRDFWQRMGWGLAALAASEAGWLRLGDRYYQALAQTSPRKLALLIGINQYSKNQDLTGCVTDVDLQRELLIHRFGFAPSDILTLSDRQATRQQIEAAFLHHLIEQARPGDVVVFHFSGYGRQVQLESQAAVQNSLVPVDGLVSTSGVPAVNDLLEETLSLLLRSLATDRVTTILDTSFISSSSNLQGNLRIRSRPELAQGQISAEALDQQLKTPHKGAYPKGIQQQNLKLKTQMPGVVLAAADSAQVATEAQWTDFSAGLFTYALTQYLWEAMPATTVQVSLNRVAEVIEQLGGRQQPMVSGQRSLEESLLTYNLSPSNIGADGVVIAVEDNGRTAQLWLAGIPLAVLEYYGVNSRLTLVDRVGEGLGEPNHSLVQLQLRSRSGLTAKAQIASDSNGPLQVGQLVQEAVRVLPRNIGLIVALDAGLERIERVDATSAFATIADVSTVLAGQPADYLFGRVPEVKTPESPVTPSSNLSSSRYGLFSLSQELIPDTAGAAGEAVKVAVQRLVPKLQTLLAAKLWRLTANAGSSYLGVKATLEVLTPQEQMLMARETRRLPDMTLSQPSALGGVSSIPIGSRIQYRVHNYSDRSVYLILLGLDSSKNAIALYPVEIPQATNGSDNSSRSQVVIAPSETITVPQAAINFDWVVYGPVGLAETQLIFSCANFTQTLAALEVAMHLKEEQQHIGPLVNPLEVLRAVLQDLHQASAVTETNSSVDVYALDVNAWASLNFTYHVVKVLGDERMWGYGENKTASGDRAGSCRFSLFTLCWCGYCSTGFVWLTPKNFPYYQLSLVW